MSTTKNTLTSITADKISELTSQIAALEDSTTLSKNTKQTQGYKLRRDRKVLHLIQYLLEKNPDVVLDEVNLETFNLITTLASERAERTSVDLNEGDSILELLQKYDGVKDLAKKLTAAAEKKNLVLNYSTGKVEAK